MVLACSLVVLAGCSARRSQQHTAIGDTQLKLGNVAQARAAYDQALRADPSNMAAELGVARCSWLNGNGEEALAAYRKVLASDAEKVEAYLEAVNILLALERVPEARELASAYEASQPEGGGMLQARIDLTTGDSEQAVERLLKLKEQFNESIPVRILLARAYLQGSQTGQAEAELNAVLEGLDPDSLPARMVLVEVYQRAGRLPELVEQLEEMVESHPDSPGLKLALGRSLIAAGRFEEAEKVAQPVLGALPESGWANFIIGCCLIEKQDYQGAIACLQTAAKALPQEPLVQKMLEIAQSGGVVPKTAAPVAKAPRGAGKVGPEEADWRALWEMAALRELLQRRDGLLAKGDEQMRELLVCAALFVEAVPLLEDLREGLPDDNPLRDCVDLLLHEEMQSLLERVESWKPTDDLEQEMRENVKGFALGVSGLRGGALKTLSDCMRTWPAHGVSIYNLSRIYGRAGMYRFQAQCLRKLLTMYPQNTEAQIELVQVLMRADLPSEARTQAEAAYSLFPSEPRVIVGLANIYRYSGDMDLALQVLEQGMKAQPEDLSLKVWEADLLLDSGDLSAFDDFVAALAKVSAAPEHRAMLSRLEMLKAFRAALDGDWQAAAALRDQPEANREPLSSHLLCIAGLLGLGQEEAAKTVAVKCKLAGQARARVLWAGLSGEKDALSEEELALAEGLSGDTEMLAQYGLALASIEARFPSMALPILRSLDERMGRPAALVSPMLAVVTSARMEGDRLETAEQIVAERPPSASVLLGLAAAAKQLDAEDVRQKALDEAIALAPDDADVWRAVGLLRDEQQDLKGALEAYRKLIELAPDDPGAQNNLAYALLQVGGDAAEALDLARRAAATLGANAHVLHTLGLAEFMSGDMKGALKNLSVALELRPGDPTLLLDYGKACIADGQEERGRQHVQQALQYAGLLDLDFPRRDEALEIVADSQ